MNVIELFKTSFQSLATNKSRTFLTVLGVVIGITSVVSLVSLGDAAQAYIQKSITSLGSNLIVGIAGRRTGTFSASTSKPFTETNFKDLNTLKYNYINAITAETTFGATVTLGNFSKQITAFAILGDYGKVRNTAIQQGGNFTDRQVNYSEGVCLIGPKLAEDIFGNSDVVGESIKLNNVKFTIVGVFEKKGQTFGASSDDSIFIPYSSFTRLLGGKDTTRFVFYASAINTSESELASLEFSSALAQVRDIKSDEDPDFFVQTSSGILKVFDQITNFFTLFLAAVAGISLLVGGIGIMNIMLVSVSERTKEIGLRKSLGAKKIDILFQFIFESILVTLLGGIFGIIFSVVLIFIILNYLGVEFIVSLNAILYAIISCMIIGIVFGIYPAVRAAKLSPIEALRSE